jgi:peptide/nickel transport system substrate-binding protein
MRDAAEFYNSGWVMNPGELLDASLIPSNGPYSCPSGSRVSP